MDRIKRLLSNGAIDRDAGLLILRLGVGMSTLVFHGWAKITGGPELWAGLGGTMGNLGISFAPAFWGFMAAFSEFFCGVFVVLGVFFRPAAALLAFTMLVGMLMHLNLPADSPKAGWSGASHALELVVVFVALIYTGAGRYAITFPWDRGNKD